MPRASASLLPASTMVVAQDRVVHHAERPVLGDAGALGGAQALLDAGGDVGLAQAVDVAQHRQVGVHRMARVELLAPGVGGRARPDLLAARALALAAPDGEAHLDLLWPLSAGPALRRAGVGLSGHAPPRT